MKGLLYFQLVDSSLLYHQVLWLRTLSYGLLTCMKYCFIKSFVKWLLVSYLSSVNIYYWMAICLVFLDLFTILELEEYICSFKFLSISPSQNLYPSRRLFQIPVWEFTESRKYDQISAVTTSPFPLPRRHKLSQLTQ